MANTPFVYEFLYRGKPDGPDAWHVQMGLEADDGFGNMKLSLSNILTMQQAADAGYTLPALLSEINTVVLVQAEQAQVQIQALQAQSDQDDT